MKKTHSSHAIRSITVYAHLTEEIITIWSADRGRGLMTLLALLWHSMQNGTMCLSNSRTMYIGLHSPCQ